MGSSCLGLTNIHISVYTHSPDSHMENMYCSIVKDFITTSLKILSKTSSVEPFLPRYIPGKVTGLYFTCLDLEDLLVS